MVMSVVVMVGLVKGGWFFDFGRKADGLGKEIQLNLKSEFIQDREDVCISICVCVCIGVYFACEFRKYMCE